MYTQTQVADYDEGMRSYLFKTFNKLAAGLGVSGVVALLVSMNPAIVAALSSGPLFWVIMLAPIGMIFVVSYMINNSDISTANMVYYAFVAIMGLSLGVVISHYTAASVASTFFITASSFLALSIFGYTTKKDLSGFGSFLIMGLWGLIAASLFAIFFPSGALVFIINVVGVLIFAGLTAVDVQNMKNNYSASYDVETLDRLVLSGAINLYLDFINLFQFLLHFLGDRD
jgi:FtsH-binding integral membrane protein